MLTRESPLPEVSLQSHTSYDKFENVRIPVNDENILKSLKCIVLRLHPRQVKGSNMQYELIGEHLTCVSHQHDLSMRQGRKKGPFNNGHFSVNYMERISASIATVVKERY